MWLRHSARSHLPAHFIAADLPLRIRFGPHETLVRWLRMDDEDKLLEFFASHTEETIYQRYGYAGVTMTPEQAMRLVSVDQESDAALGVFEEFDTQARLIAVGRFCLGADGRWAETAFVVHENRRGLGIGTTLLTALIEIARERRLERLVAEVHCDNGPMIHILRAAGASFSSMPAASAMKATITLGGPEIFAGHKGSDHRYLAETWAADMAARAALRIEAASAQLSRLPMP
jgi:ribosomal protein S18 acetylase RimI-like enzyme